MSGDLKDPSLAIPQGTLLAILLTYITYMYFGIQTSFVFSKRASGVSEEYKYFNQRGVFGFGNITDPIYGDIENFPEFQDVAKPTFELPKWTECGDEANEYRDYLKFVALPWYSNQTDDNTFKNIYDKWNTNGGGFRTNNTEDEGICMFGSGHNQMTMTYISFTGWLR